MSPVECAAWVGGTWLAIAAVWAIVRAVTWAWQQLAAADQWIHDTQADPGSLIDDDELADQVAIWTADYQAGCDRHRDAIDQAEEGEQQ